MKICFWGENADALCGSPHGGGELQIALLAKALVKIGHEVVFVGYNIQTDFETEEGIKVFAVKGYNKGVKFLRAFRRLRLIYSYLKDQKADLYYCRIRDFRHILAYWASRKMKARFILALASDIDIMGFEARLKYFYLTNINGLWWFFNGIMTEIIYPWLLRKSDLILVQHEGQKKLLSERKIKSTILYNLIDLNEIPHVPEQEKSAFCYVGSLDKRKGFIEFYEIIKNAPDSTFKIIGNPRDQTGDLYYEKCKLLKNVTLLGRLSHAETLYQISNSKALISTSPMEGFPNIFIEAWACGIPVISLYFDPGRIIEREKLGFVANGRSELLIQALSDINKQPDCGNRCKLFVERNHVLNETRLNEIKTLFDSVLNVGQIKGN